MKATPLEFRFRVAIITALYFLGFFAPWERLGAAAAANPPRLWSWLAIEAARTSFFSVGRAYLVVTVIAIALAILGAALRVWGTAYIGHFVMRNPRLQADTVMASGPYRHLRNPLYLGMLLGAFAVAVLMPLSGAVVFIALLVVFTLRLILAEESFLAARLGSEYRQYRQAVPSILPTLRSRVPGSGARPHWLRALLAECFPVGIAGCFAALAWNYDAPLLTRCVLVCFGVSLIFHALLSSRATPATTAS